MLGTPKTQYHAMRLAASRSQPSRKQPNHTFIKSSNTTFKLARSLRAGGGRADAGLHRGDGDQE